MKRILLPLLFGLVIASVKAQTLYITPNPVTCVNCLVPLAMAKAISQDLHPTIILPEMSQKDAKYLITRQWKIDTNLVKYRINDSLARVYGPMGQSMVHLQDSTGRIWLQFELKELSIEVERVNGFFGQGREHQTLTTVPDHINLPGYNQIIPEENSILFLNHASSSVAFWNRTTDQWLQFHPDDWQFPHLDSVLQYFPANQPERWERLNGIASINVSPLKYEHAHFDGKTIWITAKYFTEQGIVNGKPLLRTDPILIQYSPDGKFRAAHFVNLDSLRDAGIVLGSHSFWMEGKTAILPLKQGDEKKHIPYLNGKFELQKNQWRFRGMEQMQYPDSMGLDTLHYEAKMPKIHADHIIFGFYNFIWNRKSQRVVKLQVPVDLEVANTIQSPLGYRAILFLSASQIYFVAEFNPQGQIQHIIPVNSDDSIKLLPQFLNPDQIIFLDQSDNLKIIQL